MAEAPDPTASPESRPRGQTLKPAAERTATQAEGITLRPTPPHSQLRAEKARGSRSYPLLLRQLDRRTPRAQHGPLAHGHHQERRGITARTRQARKAGTHPQRPQFCSKGEL